MSFHIFMLFNKTSKGKSGFYMKIVKLYMNLYCVYINFNIFIYCK